MQREGLINAPIIGRTWPTIIKNVRTILDQRLRYFSKPGPKSGMVQDIKLVGVNAEYVTYKVFLRPKKSEDEISI